MRKSKKRHSVVRSILRWYRQEGRSLPWRGITNPYRILVSEVMLQQTQVSRVLIKYPQFIKRFPSLKRLAGSSQRDVVLEWQGMGYNNRAVRLHKFAQTVMTDYHGAIPADFDALMSLPGIGRYTANALLASAFGKRVPVVDVNVQRVLSRIFRRMPSTAATQPAEKIWLLAGKLIPAGSAYDWNQALMDLGATMCTARSPQCGACPVARYCSSGKSMRRASKSTAKQEERMNGIPRRLYRGKIIELLRQRNGNRSFTLQDIARRVEPSVSHRQLSWLAAVVDDLRNDGLVRVSGNGSLRTRRVALA